MFALGISDFSVGEGVYPAKQLLSLARGLGWLNGRVLLSLVFYVFLTPIAWLSRLSSSSSFLRSKKPVGESYFTERSHTYEKKDLEQTW